MELRELRAGDEPALLRLLSASMGWSADARDAAYLRWKHRESPFGPSSGWVAVADGEIVGLRLFMHWEFTDGHRTHRAVRAVDTATHPDHRGKGIFTRLTMRGVECLEAEGVAFVFNTPNGQSLPGYLKMGWRRVGRLPLAVAIRSPLVLPRLARSRVAAERAPVATDVGVPALEALADADRLQEVRPAGGLATPRTSAFLRWRYGHEPLGYRAWEPPSGGVVLFRLRRRGRATELVIADLLAVPPADASRAVTRLVRLSGADHALRVAEAGSPRSRLAPPGLGPMLTWRGLRWGEAPPLNRWRLAMGDVELF